MDVLEDLKKKYVAWSPKELREIPQFQRETEQYFHRFGPQLWPSLPPSHTAAWLLDAEQENWNGLWERNYTYHREEDREVLRNRFHELVYAKVKCYGSNKRHKNKRIPEEESQSAQTFDTSLSNSLVGTRSHETPASSDPGATRQGSYYDMQFAQPMVGLSRAPVARMVETPQPQFQYESIDVHRDVQPVAEEIEFISITSSPPQYETPEPPQSLKQDEDSQNTRDYEDRIGADDEDDEDDEDHYGSPPTVRSGKRRHTDDDDEWRPRGKLQRTQSPVRDSLIAVLKLPPTTRAGQVARKTPSRFAAFQDTSLATSDVDVDGDQPTSPARPSSQIAESSNTDVLTESLEPVSQAQPGVHMPGFHGLPVEQTQYYLSRMPPELIRLASKVTERLAAEGRINTQAPLSRTQNPEVIPQKSPQTTFDDPEPASRIVSPVPPVPAATTETPVSLHDEDKPFAVAAAFMVNGLQNSTTETEVVSDERENQRMTAGTPMRDSAARVASTDRAEEMSIVEPTPSSSPPYAQNETSADMQMSERDVDEPHGQPEKAGSQTVEHAEDAAGDRHPTPATSQSKIEPPTSPAKATAEPCPTAPTALERADVLVYMGEDAELTDMYDLLDLTDCKTHVDFFVYLRNLIPGKMKDKKIEYAAIRLENAGATVLEKKPNFRIREGISGRRGFEWFVRGLQAYAEDFRPHLTCTVHFCED